MILGRPVERKTVVLVGGGHAHVQVLKSWAMDPPPGARLLVVVDRPVAVYSGMVPGFVAGDYRLDELEIDVLPLARRAGAGVIRSRATDIDPLRGALFLEDRPPLAFDYASIDVGSTVRGLELPGVREHALATRPIGDFVLALDAQCERLGALGRPPRVLVVGGGAAGSEIALTLRARLVDAGLQPEMALVTADETLLDGASSALRNRLHREVAHARIEIIRGMRVLSVDAQGARLAPRASSPASSSPSSRSSSPSASPSSSPSTAASEPDPGARTVPESEPSFRPADLVIWATGAAATDFARPGDMPGTATAERGRLAQDEFGFLEIRDTLQTTHFDTVFAVGDCARLVDHRWVPRAGVYAVRQGPVLDHNLRAMLRGGRLRRYSPQRDFLSLLNLGAGRALGGKWGLAFAGRPVARLKDSIDRGFMKRFQVLADDGSPRPALADLGAMDEDGDSVEMACGGCAAKLGALPLDAALALLPPAAADESVLLGLDERDDVAATRSASGEIVLHNIDVIRAFCDDPYLVGRVAATNALSDLYAKGGIPKHAQAIIGLPDEKPAVAREILFQALSGLRATLDEAGVTLLGGHTTIGDALSIGLSVSGEGLSEAFLLRQAGAQPGDALLMTQPIGTGVLLAADMQGLARGEWIAETHRWMLRTNAVASAIARDFAVHASTDITGFGLAGHCFSLLEPSDLTAVLDRQSVPLLPGARGLWGRGLRSTAHPQNRAAFLDRISGATELDEAWLFDPQTAGGLLLAVRPNQLEPLVAAFLEKGEPAPIEFGRFIETPEPGSSRGRIEVADSIPA